MGMEQVTAAHAQETDLSGSASSAPAAEGAGSASKAKKRVLVIDDSPTIRAVTELALCQDGYLTRSFPDGVEAMQWLVKSEGWLPDLAIVDIGLPKMDGYEVMRRLKANPRFAKTVCIMLSARDGAVDQLKGRLVGARMCLTKPCPVEVLRPAVRICLASEPEAGQDK